MSTSKYIRFYPDGKTQIVKEDVQDAEIAESIIEKFGKDVVRTLKRAFPTPNGVSHVIQTGSEVFMVARLAKINLLSHYEPIKEGVLVPVFIRETDPTAKNYPIMPLIWQVPDEMVLLFAARILNTASLTEPVMTHKDQNCYLIAYNVKKQAWLLPLPNLYNDCAICMGAFDGHADSAAQAFVLAMQQFEKSSWNSDLLDGRTDQARKLFKFQVKDNETTSIPIETDWTKQCVKVSTPVTELISKLL